MRTILERIFLNWKTSLAGLLGFVLCYLLYTGKITTEQYELILGILASMGLLVTRDFAKKKPRL